MKNIKAADFGGRKEVRRAGAVIGGNRVETGQFAKDWIDDAEQAPLHIIVMSCKRGGHEMAKQDILTRIKSMRPIQLCPSTRLLSMMAVCPGHLGEGIWESD